MSMALCKCGHDAWEHDSIECRDLGCHQELPNGEICDCLSSRESIFNAEIKRLTDREQLHAEILIRTIGNRSLDNFEARWVELNQDLSKLTARNAELTEALRIYANNINWSQFRIKAAEALVTIWEKNDHGYDIARATLIGEK